MKANVDLKYYKNDGKEYIDGRNSKEITLEIALQEIGNLPFTVRDNFIGFINEKGQTIQFPRYEKDNWLIDVPVFENGRYSYSLNGRELTTEKVKEIVKRFFLGEDWQSVCNLKQSSPIRTKVSSNSGNSKLDREAFIKKRETFRDNLNIDLVEMCITRFGWFPFGKKEFECTGLKEDTLDFYKKNNQLPEPCDKCFKGLIFWHGVTNENIINFLKMLDSFEVNYRGKLNKGVVVFYFRDKDKMLKFLDFLQEKMQEFNVKGKIQWRRACKEYQDLKPELWKNAKEFILNP